MSKPDKKKIKGPIKESEFNETRSAPMAGRGREFLVERLIQDGMAEGKFSNLLNEGRPLKMEEENPYIEEDMRLAYKVLETAKIAPPWIEMDKEVQTAIDQAQRERDNHRQWLKHRLNEIAHGPLQLFTRSLHQLSTSHEHWLQNHAKKLTELNQRIHAFNQICPVNDLLKVPMQVDKLIQEYDRSCPAIPKL